MYLLVQLRRPPGDLLRLPLLQKEMGLDNVQLGLLGSSFAWVYGLGALFAGIIVDRVQRRTAILGGLHAWSLICMATGMLWRGSARA